MSSLSTLPRRQGKYWIGTIPVTSRWVPCLPPGVVFLCGQEEEGGETGYSHYQVFLITQKKESVRSLGIIFGVTAHWELTRSSAAEAYCLKEDTRAGSMFSFGTKPLSRNSKTDWENIWKCAVEGRIADVPVQVRVQHYRTLQRIATDYLQPSEMVRTAVVYWGRTGTGKSRRAWSEAGLQAYPKDPRTKFWCGYQGQESVVIDEFRGTIDVANMLRWLDRYPVIVEIKGGAQVLQAKKLWITSNLEPKYWYPDLDVETRDALLRRLEIIEIQ